jgi:hypothetical protein
MAEVLGPQSILSKGLPTGVDSTRVAQWTLREGRAWQQVMADLALAIGDFNQQLVANWGWMFSLTEDIMLEYPNGGSVSELPELPEVGLNDPVHGTTIGHMIDLKAYGRPIGGSKRFFRDAREAQLFAMIRVVINQATWRFEKKLLTRAFTNTENAVGSAGYDVPFVRGTGGNVDFAPPAYSGEAFTTSHDHFMGVDDDSYDYNHMLNQMAENLQEHGHEPPYTAIVSRTDISTIYALEDFVEIVDPVVQLVDRGAASSGAQFYTRGQREMGMIGGFQSEYGYIALRATSRVPTKYAGLYKTYGQLDARNPLRVRVHPDVGFGFYIVPETTQDDKYPIKEVHTEFEFGVGVGEDRTNGVVGYLVSGGTYANPTIS